MNVIVIVRVPELSAQPQSAMPMSILSGEALPRSNFTDPRSDGCSESSTDTLRPIAKFLDEAPWWFCCLAMKCRADSPP
jgi:hypothetical protein